MDKSELESKHLAELHELAAGAGIERYRMLPRAELIEKLAGGEAGGGDGGSSGGRGRERGGRDRERGKDRERGRGRDAAGRSGGKRSEKEDSESRRSSGEGEDASEGEEGRPRRRRRRRRWGRKRKGIRLHDLLLPGAAGRQAILCAESRDAVTELLREVAAEISGASKGPDPVAVLVDPSPEELADWKRDAPDAEIVSAGKPQHAQDALSQAASRAAGGEDVIVLVDSLSRYAESFDGAEEARELFDSGRSTEGDGSLTVVAALERPE